MIPKISIVAALFLMVAPPMACASTRDAFDSAPATRSANQSTPPILVAQDAQPAMGTAEDPNGGDNAADADDNAADDNNNADNQDGDANQADQNNAGDDQPVPPTVLNGNDDPGEVPPINGSQQWQPMNPQQ